MSKHDDEPRAVEPSRRAVLVSAAAAAGVLSLGFMPQRASAQILAAQASGFSSGDPEITCWVVIQPDNSVVIRLARPEMGQGVFTALPQLVAEELECDWSKVSVEFVPPSENLRRNLAWQERLLRGAPKAETLTSHWGSLATNAGRSIADSQLYLRHVGAIARTMLIEAAAKDWNVSAFDCTADAGVITHAQSGRKTTFARVAGAAAALPPPTQVQLKDPKAWKLAAKPTRQLDTRAKVDGTLTYAIDVRLPGMLHATISRCPVFGGKIAAIEPQAIEGRSGVRHVVQLDDATVCVIADTFWQAKTALAALPVTWDEGANAQVDSAAIDAAQRTGLVADDAAIAYESGDTVAALLAANRIVDAQYATPFLHQAALEPMNCTARVRDGRVEVWAGTQDPESALGAAAKAAGVDHDRVYVHRMHMGGAFGRRGLGDDVVRLAVLASKRAGGRPVKLIFSREQDMTHGLYRPASHVRFKGALDDKGNVTGLYVRIAGQSINAWHRPRLLEGRLDREQANGFLGEDFAYRIGSRRIEVAMRNTHVPVGWWRSQNYSQNSFYRECFIDELAAAAGKDPFEFRKSLLGQAARPLRVLEMAADKSDWSSAPTRGVARGIALEQSFGTAQASVAEVSVGPGGTLRIHRIVNAIDCGHVVNPNGIDHQLTGAAAMALTAMLHGEISIERGRVKETDYDTYPMLRLADMPPIENHILGSFDGWGGVGKASLPSIAPAVCNAIFAATGKRIRSLPLKHHNLART